MPLSIIDSKDQSVQPSWNGTAFQSAQNLPAPLPLVNPAAQAAGPIGPQGENLIFLISQPRSGSTLLQRVLAGQPEIFASAEPWIMLHPLQALKDNGYSAEYNAEWARAALRDFCGLLPNGEEDYVAAVRGMAVNLYNAAMTATGRRCFLDKTPRYYSICPDLRKTFPRASFIILLRNPLAVLASILESWVKEDWKQFELFRQDLLAAPGLMLQALEELGSAAFKVRYEELVLEPETVVAGLCARLGLAFHPDMLDYGSRPKPQGNMGDQIGINQHQKPVTDNVEKWQRTLAEPRANYFARRYLGALDASVLAKLGYPAATLLASLPPLDETALDAEWRRWADGFFGVSPVVESPFGRLDNGSQKACEAKPATTTTQCAAAIRPATSPEVEQLLKIAGNKFAAGDLAVCRATLEEALTIEPQNPEVITSYASVLFQAGEIASARAQFERSLALQPDARVATQLALACLHLEDIPAFEAGLGKALALDADCVDALRVLLNLNVEAGRYADAAEGCRHILRLEPGDTATRLLLGRCLAELGDWTRAEAVYLKVLETDAQNEIARQNLAVVHQKLIRPVASAGPGQIQAPAPGEALCARTGKPAAPRSEPREWLKRYQPLFPRVEGWLHWEAVEVLNFLNTAQMAQGVSGNFAEIGAYQGKFSLAMATFLNPEKELLLVNDIFDAQDLNTSCSGVGAMLAAFRKNFLELDPDPHYVRLFRKRSDALTPSELGGNIRFFSVDGGHSCEETFSDLRLAAQTLHPLGMIVLDDYFNSNWPGVEAGVSAYFKAHSDLAPLLAFYNKFVFVKRESLAWFHRLLEAHQFEAFCRDHHWVTLRRSLHGFDYHALPQSPPKQPAVSLEKPFHVTATNTAKASPEMLVAQAAQICSQVSRLNYSTLKPFYHAFEEGLDAWITPRLGFSITSNPYGQIFPALNQKFETWLDAMRQHAAEVIPFIHSPKLAAIPEKRVDDVTPYWQNDYFHPGDARLAYAMVARYRPQRIIECGCGNSTRFMRRAANDYQTGTQIICIDPEPRANIRGVADQFYQASATTIEPAFFDQLEAGDFLFIDGSHLVMNGSDCVHLFLNVLPRLRSGVWVHIHDVFLPFDYPYELHVACRYNEQYMLAQLFLYSRDWLPALPIYYAHKKNILPQGGGSFWMRKL